MNRKTLCIVIALMVLSISAIIGANPNILGGFSNTLNGVPVEVTISRQDNGTITTMLMEDLLKNWKDHSRRFVRFIGTVTSVTSIDTGIELELDLGAEAEGVIDNLFVYPLDSPHLPTEYQEGHVYEFTGFSVAATTLVEADLLVLAFEIRHHGKSEVTDDTSGIVIK